MRAATTARRALAARAQSLPCLVRLGGMGRCGVVLQQLELLCRPEGDAAAMGRGGGGGGGPTLLGAIVNAVEAAVADVMS